jgi:hypothetical protein
MVRLTLPEIGTQSIYASYASSSHLQKPDFDEPLLFLLRLQLWQPKALEYILRMDERTTSKDLLCQQLRVGGGWMQLIPERILIGIRTNRCPRITTDGDRIGKAPSAAACILAVRET